MHAWSAPEVTRRCLGGGASHDVGALPAGGVVRSNPLPLGAFWLDVFAPSTARPEVKNGELVMRAWLAANVDSVRVVKREEHAEGTLSQPSAFPGFGGPATVAPAPFRYFYVFQVVRAPAVDFPFTALGFPSVVKLGSEAEVKPADVMTTSDDTVAKPAAQPLFDFGPLAEAAEKVAMVVAGVAVLWLVVKATD